MSDRGPAAAAFDMPDASHTFEERGGWLVTRLAADFNLQTFQAAGIVGNLGFESGGFKDLRELGQPEGLGGYGWGQWTADRRRAFLAYAESRGLDWRSDEANYDYLTVELKGVYHRTITAVSQTTSLEDAVFSVGQTYERPGGTTASFLPGYDGRLKYAQRALAGASAVPIQPAPTPPASPAPLVIPDLVAAIQRALNEQAGASLSVDGVFGPRTYNTLMAWQNRR